MTARKKSIIKGIVFLILGFACFVSPSIFADTTQVASGAVGSLADNVKASFSSIVQLITAAAYVMGFGFVLVAIFKFKQHKDNPTQMQIGTPIAMLFIGAAMIFLPSIIKTTGATVFGSDASAGGISGVDSIDGIT
ncbi:MAG: type IV secretion protein IcmD [Legionellales bacterium]|nr:type IV secretion protein IcmD [Legionellales bacterium]|tara:strand:- start:117 stop:524 length:408 start_codon:yes stop_codon:yes gene_type:complete